MKKKLENFMRGRYGLDAYGQFLSTLSIICMVLGLILAPLNPRFNLMSTLGLVLIIYSYFRIFSKQHARRAQENYLYYGLVAGINSKLKNFKARMAIKRTHRIFACPSCKQKLRVPKNRGKIAITCNRCKTEFVKKT